MLGIGCAMATSCRADACIRPPERCGRKLHWRVVGDADPYRVAESKVGDVDEVRGRHVCRPYGWAVCRVMALGMREG